MDSVVATPADGLRTGPPGPAVPLTPGASIALDQWRGLALVIVLAAHAFALTDRAWGLGRIGVNLFFFISGILVFRSLIPGPEETGSKPGKWALSFLLRRLRRLLPAFLVYVALMIPVVGLIEGREGLIHYAWSLPYTLTFTTNYPEGIHISQHHLWSLCCEIQFYFLAPLLFLAGGIGSIRRALVWGGILAVAVAVGLIPSLLHLTGSRNHFEFSVWPLLLGFAAEAVKNRLPLPPFLLRAGIAVGLTSLVVSLVLISGQYHAEYLAIILGTGVLPACFLCYRGGFILDGPLGRAAIWMGKRTYSIYLWQEPFTLCGYLPDLLRPLGALVAIPIGALSYAWLERPFLSKVHRRPTAAQAAATDAETARTAALAPCSGQHPQ